MKSAKSGSRAVLLPQPHNSTDIDIPKSNLVIILPLSMSYVHSRA